MINISQSNKSNKYGITYIQNNILKSKFKQSIIINVKLLINNKKLQ